MSVGDGVEKLDLVVGTGFKGEVVEDEQGDGHGLLEKKGGPAGMLPVHEFFQELVGFEEQHIHAAADGFVADSLGDVTFTDAGRALMDPVVKTIF